MKNDIKKQRRRVVTGSFLLSTLTQMVKTNRQSHTLSTPVLSKQCSFFNEQQNPEESSNKKIFTGCFAIRAWEKSIHIESPYKTTQGVLWPKSSSCIYYIDTMLCCNFKFFKVWHTHKLWRTHKSVTYPWKCDIFLSHPVPEKKREQFLIEGLGFW